jgi:hypothetical protein
MSIGQLYCIWLTQCVVAKWPINGWYNLQCVWLASIIQCILLTHYSMCSNLGVVLLSQCGLSGWPAGQLSAWLISAGSMAQLGYGCGAAATAGLASVAAVASLNGCGWQPVCVSMAANQCQLCVTTCCVIVLCGILFIPDILCVLYL